MIILYTIGLSILLLFFASCSLAPAYIVFNDFYDSIHRPTKNRHRCLTYRSRIYIVKNIGLFFLLIFLFLASGVACFSVGSELYFLWNPEKRPIKPEKPREIHIQVPEKVQVHTEFRLDDTIIGKDVL